MVSEYFYVAFNDGLFSGMSVEFIEGLSAFLGFVSIVLIFPLVVLYEEKKTKPFIKCLMAFIPTMLSVFIIIWFTPYNGTVRVVSCKDKNKYILVEGLDVAKEVARVANDDSVRNKEKIDSSVEALLNLEKRKMK